MPGLKQAGIVTNDRLTLHLTKHSYSPIPHTPSLWAHAHLPIMFSLVIDSFGVKYTGNAAAHHLIAALCSLYTISVDWSGSLFCILTLAWDYANWTVDFSMPGYIDKALNKFQYSHPKRQQDAPHAWTQPIYGVKFQYADNIDDSPALLPKTVRLVQKIVGTLLYYAIAIKITAIVALSSIASTQS